MAASRDCFCGGKGVGSPAAAGSGSPGLAVQRGGSGTARGLGREPAVLIRLRAAPHRAGEGEAGSSGAASREARWGVGRVRPGRRRRSPCPRPLLPRCHIRYLLGGHPPRPGRGASGRLYAPGPGCPGLSGGRGGRLCSAVPLPAARPGSLFGSGGAPRPRPGWAAGGLRGPGGGDRRRGRPERGAPLGPSRAA